MPIKEILTDTERELTLGIALKKISEFPNGPLFVEIFQQHTNPNSMIIHEIHTRNGFDGFVIYATIDGVASPKGVASSISLELLRKHTETTLEMRLPLVGGVDVEVSIPVHGGSRRVEPRFISNGISCVEMSDPRMEKSLEILLEFAKKVFEYKG